MHVSEAVEEYSYAILKHSPATQEWYLSRLKPFTEWCEQQNLQLEDVKPTQVRKYIEQVRTTPSKTTGKLLSSYTVHGHARTIRAFLNFCTKEEGLDELVSIKTAKRIDMPKIDKRVMQVFKPNEIQALLKACSKEVYPELQMRSYAAVCLLYETGIRAGELCGLTLDCVFLTPASSYIRVFGKGRKEREVGLGIAASKALHKYIHRFRNAPRPETHVFLTRSHTAMTVSGLDQMLYRLAEWARVEDAHAHKFRHTFAVNYLAAGGDLFDLARLMGHSTTEVTRLYLETYSSTQARQKGISVLDTLGGGR
jgi:site-specific recombinase XerD